MSKSAKSSQFVSLRKLLSPLTIDGYKLEMVQTCKSCQLCKATWQIRHIVPKASKRVHTLHVLSCGCVPPADLMKVYDSLIHSILEYSCKVWSYAISRYLLEELKKMQKCAMHIILPGHSYDEALQLANCTRHSDRRNKIFIKTLHKIVKSGDPELVPNSIKLGT